MKFVSVLVSCIRDVLFTVTSQNSCNVITTHRAFVISIIWREHLTDCNVNLQFKAEVNEQPALGLEQFINLPTASFLCLGVTVVSVFEFKMLHTTLYGDDSLTKSFLLKFEVYLLEVYFI